MSDCNHDCETKLWVIILLLFCTCSVCENEERTEELESKYESTIIIDPALIEGVLP